MTYLVGGVGGGGVSSVNGDAGPAVTLIASEVGAMPGEIYANEAALIAATPAEGDGTKAYAETEDTYWVRTEGKWIREGSKANDATLTDYAELNFLNGDTTAFPFVENGFAMLDSTIGVFTQGDRIGARGVGVGKTLLKNATVESSVSGTISLNFGGGAKTVDVAMLTFVAAGSFTANFANMFSNSEKMSIWNVWDAVATPNPTKANTMEHPTYVYLSESTTSADIGWYIVYDYVNDNATNDGLLIIPWSQILTVIMGGTPTLAPVTANAGCKASIFSLSSVIGDTIPGYFICPQEYYSPSTGAAVVGINHGQTLSCIIGQNSSDGNSDFVISGVNDGVLSAPVGYFKNSASGTSATAIIYGEEANVASAVPVAYLSQLGIGAHLRANALAAAPTMVAGEISYVAGATNRWVYRDNVGNKSIANTSDLYVAKVSSNDTTGGYLNGKLVAGTGITLIENNDAGNETLSITTNSRIQTVVSSATVTPNVDSYDAITITAQAAALNIANFTGTPVNFQKLIVRIKDDSTPRAITYGTNYIDMGATRPVTTVSGKITRLEFEYDSVSGAFGLIQLNQEA